MEQKKGEEELHYHEPTVLEVVTDNVKYRDYYDRWVKDNFTFIRTYELSESLAKYRDSLDSSARAAFDRRFLIDNVSIHKNPKVTHHHQRSDDFTIPEDILEKNKANMEIYGMHMKWEEVWEENPHLTQSLYAGYPIINMNRNVELNDLFLKFNEPTSLTYRERDSKITRQTKKGVKYNTVRCEAKTAEHWGQRKLFFSELAFLLLIGVGEDKDAIKYYQEMGRIEREKKRIETGRVNDALLEEAVAVRDFNMLRLNTPKPLVIYVGAASGIHTNYLCSDFFNNAHYLLIDPGKFEAWETDNIEIVTGKEGMFDNNKAKELKGKIERNRGAFTKIIFICDVRYIDEKEKMQMEKQKGAYISNFDYEEFAVERDMKNQMKWVEILEPDHAMLKFRLPFITDKTGKDIEVEYLDGHVLHQIWQGQTSTETRLIVDKKPGDNPFPLKKYSSRDYESRMFHHNMVTRMSYWGSDTRIEGIDHCFDCSAEIFLLNWFLHVTEPSLNHESLIEERMKRIKYLSESISRNISIPRKREATTTGDENKRVSLIKENLPTQKTLVTVPVTKHPDQYYTSYLTLTNVSK